MTSAEIAARKAALAQFRASFNAFAAAYNAALQAMQPFAAEYQPMMVGLNTMAAAVNKASPAVTVAIQQTDVLVPDDPARTPSPDGTTAASVVDGSGAFWSLGPSRETLRDGVHISGGYATEGLYAKADGLIFARSNVWSKFTGDGWALATEQEIEMLIRSNPINRPTVPSQPPAEGFTPSANGFTVPDDGPELTDNQGQVWSLGGSLLDGNLVLVGGVSFNGGLGVKIKFLDGIVYVLGPPEGGSIWWDWWFANGVGPYSWRNNGTTEPGTTAPSLPTAPSVCVATMATHSRNNVAWQDNSDNEVGFKLEQKLTVGGTWAQIATPAMNAESFASTGLLAATSYDYRVASYNQAGTSEWSNIASATTDTAPALPGALALKESATTGAISASSNQLVVASSTGFAQHDWIIVEIGQEPGGGMRGTKGVGPNWPAKSYADGATMTADTTQPPNTYAWREDTGDVLRWNSEFGANQWVSNYGYNGTYYAIVSLPRALQAQILNISGTTWTLDRNAEATVSGANVYFDNAPLINEAIARKPEDDSTTPDGVTVVTPAGDFAVGGVTQICTKTGWTFTGQGKDETRFFSPKGCPSIRLQTIYSPNTTVKAFTWEGNFGANQFGLSFYTPGHVWDEVNYWPPVISETDLNRGPQGSHFPQAITFNQSPNSLEQDVRVINSFQHAFDAFISDNTTARNVECIQNHSELEYINWLLHWGDSTGGLGEGCSIICTEGLCNGYEGFKQNGLTLRNCTGHNTYCSMNVLGNFLFEDMTLTVDADIFAPPFNAGVSLLSVNSFIQAQSGGGFEFMLGGGTIRRLSMTQLGYADAETHMTIKGIGIGPNNPNVTIEDCSYTAPDYFVGAVGLGPLALDSEGANTVVDGFTVTGLSQNVVQGGVGYPNGYVRNGSVANATGLWWG